MDISRHIGFRNDEGRKLLDYLRANNIPHKESEILTSLDILESNPHWQDIAAFVEKGIALNTVSQTVFTQQELDEAQWLQVRSCWHFEYPQPENKFEYETITYNAENSCVECGAGLVQAAPFRMKKVPRWGKRAFFQLNWVSDELFTNTRGKEKLEQSNFSGVVFREVLDKKGISPLEDIYQMEVCHQLKPGIVEPQSYIDKIQHCPHCGIPKYHSRGIGMMQYHKEAFLDAPDIVKTSEVFGWGHYAPRTILVRNGVYRTLISQGLAANLIFEPIDLV